MLGHQLAVHEMAGLLGVAVPQVSLIPLQHPVLALEAPQARLFGVYIRVLGSFLALWVHESLWLCLKLVPHNLFCFCCTTCTDLGQYSFVRLIRVGTWWVSCTQKALGMVQGVLSGGSDIELSQSLRPPIHPAACALHAATMEDKHI